MLGNGHLNFEMEASAKTPPYFYYNIVSVYYLLIKVEPNHNIINS